ncbi:trithorax group protein osa-like [Bactrocera neohumeralis]|uniref:trithorax group protein osa-like n=1 Tax=Bactrocera neohumeralis TaxID=98809 RepID=UPI002166B8D3|nr:trithorax group protein osa-like [Bactrocera neohumeralis]
MFQPSFAVAGQHTEVATMTTAARKEERRASEPPRAPPQRGRRRGTAPSSSIAGVPSFQSTSKKKESHKKNSSRSPPTEAKDMGSSQQQEFHPLLGNLFGGAAGGDEHLLFSLDTVVVAEADRSPSSRSQQQQTHDTTEEQKRRMDVSDRVLLDEACPLPMEALNPPTPAARTGSAGGHPSGHPIASVCATTIGEGSIDQLPSAFGSPLRDFSATHRPTVDPSTPLTAAPAAAGKNRPAPDPPMGKERGPQRQSHRPPPPPPPPPQQLLSGGGVSEEGSLDGRLSTGSVPLSTGTAASDNVQYQQDRFGRRSGLPLSQQGAGDGYHYPYAAPALSPQHHHQQHHHQQQQQLYGVPLPSPSSLRTPPPPPVIGGQWPPARPLNSRGNGFPQDPLSRRRRPRGSPCRCTAHQTPPPLPLAHLASPTYLLYQGARGPVHIRSSSTSPAMPWVGPSFSLAAVRSRRRRPPPLGRRRLFLYGRPVSPTPSGSSTTSSSNYYRAFHHLGTPRTSRLASLDVAEAIPFTPPRPAAGAYWQSRKANPEAVDARPTASGPPSSSLQQQQQQQVTSGGGGRPYVTTPSPSTTRPTASFPIPAAFAYRGAGGFVEGYAVAGAPLQGSADQEKGHHQRRSQRKGDATGSGGTPLEEARGRLPRATAVLRGWPSRLPHQPDLSTAPGCRRRRERKGATPALTKGSGGYRSACARR